MMMNIMIKLFFDRLDYLRHFMKTAKNLINSTNNQGFIWSTFNQLSHASLILISALYIEALLPYHFIYWGAVNND